MLDLAKRKLRQILDDLRPEIARGTPVVGLEPSCVATFRDEMCSLFPHDEDAKRLREQTYLLSEFLVERAKGWTAPRLERKALVHGHCHHKSVLGFDAEQELLRRMGLDAEVLDSGCCGMAGSFGFEREKFDISMTIGEQKLLPRARACPPEALLIADGFSCREQVEQGTGKVPLHVAQVLQLALRRWPEPHASGFPPVTPSTSPFT